MRSITCPALCGIGVSLRGEAVEFGVVEYIQDILLPGALSTVEHCDFTLRMSALLTPMRGPEQVGKRIDLSDYDWTIVQQLARLPRDPHTPENLVAFATCNRAILLAGSVSEPSAAAPAPVAQAAE